MPSALQGFVHIEEDIVLEAEDALALIPPRAHVPQQLSVAPWVSILRRFHWVFCFLLSAPGFSRLNFFDKCESTAASKFSCCVRELLEQFHVPPNAAQLGSWQYAPGPDLCAFA